MGNIFGALGRGLANAGEAAVKASPYALNAVMQVKAEKDADLQKALQQLYQRNADSRAEMASSLAYSKQLETNGLTDARIQALRNPMVPVSKVTDADNKVQLLPTRVQQGQSVTPIATGVSAPPKAAPRIDPLSTQGVTATADRAGKVAAATAPFRPKPQQPGVFVANKDDPTAPPVYTPRDQAFGSTKPVTAAGGGQSLSAEDRNRMLAQARLDNQTMKDYETKVLSGRAKVGTAAGVAGALSDAHQGALGKVTGVLANAATGAMDPDYQRYITAQRSYGRVMGNLQSKRYTDNQAEIERSISGLQGNDLAGTIRYKQALRDASLSDSEAPAHAAPSGGRGGAPPKAGKPTASDYGIFSRQPE